MSYKNLGGRPLKFKSVDLLEEQIEAYFDKCDKEERPYTVSGLALYLDTDRATLLRWQDEENNYKELSEEDNKRLCNAIKKAKQRIEGYAEEQLFRKTNVAGVIFNMKNNWNWADKQEIVNIDNNKADLSGLTTDEIREYIRIQENK